MYTEFSYSCFGVEMVLEFSIWKYLHENQIPICLFAYSTRLCDDSMPGFTRNSTVSISKAQTFRSIFVLLCQLFIRSFIYCFFFLCCTWSWCTLSLAPTTGKRIDRFSFRFTNRNVLRRLAKFFNDTKENTDSYTLISNEMVLMLLLLYLFVCVLALFNTPVQCDTVDLSLTPYDVAIQNLSFLLLFVSMSCVCNGYVVARSHSRSLSHLRMQCMLTRNSFDCLLRSLCAHCLHAYANVRVLVSK